MHSNTFFVELFAQDLGAQDLGTWKFESDIHRKHLGTIYFKEKIRERGNKLVPVQVQSFPTDKQKNDLGVDKSNLYCRNLQKVPMRIPEWLISIIWCR